MYPKSISKKRSFYVPLLLSNKKARCLLLCQLICETMEAIVLWYLVIELVQWMHAINLACKYMFFSRIEGLMANVRFSFVSDKQVAEVRENRVPSATKRHTLWCIKNVYEQWAAAMNNAWVPRFCARVKRAKNLLVHQVSTMGLWNNSSIGWSRCENYERSVSNIHLGAILQEASLQKVTININ